MADASELTPGRDGHPSSPEQSRENQATDDFTPHSKAEGWVGGVAQSSMKFGKAEFQQACISMIEYNSMRRNCRVGWMVSTVPSLHAPRARRVTCDEVALTLTTSKAGSLVKLITFAKGLVSHLRSTVPRRG